MLAGLFGSLCGVIIGVVVSLQLTPIIEWIEKLIGHQFLSSDIYFIDFLPSELHWLDVFYVLVTALLLSLWQVGIRRGAPVILTLRESLAASKGSTLKQGAAMYYGFDIGGTKIALGVFDSVRQLQWEKRVPTPRDSYDAF